MKVIVLDTEGIGLGSKTEKLWNLCSTENGEDFFYTTDYEEMKKHLDEADLIACHNLVDHDVEAFKAVLNYSLPLSKCIDTLAVSWALYPDRAKHGLESWGETFGVPKVVVREDQWAEGDMALMEDRVKTDVKINWLMWKKAEKLLKEIYGNDTEGMYRYLRYLSFKMDCLSEQAKNPLKIDLDLCKEHMEELQVLAQEKEVELKQAMPKLQITHERPTKYKKKDGTLSVAGEKWDAKCEQFGQAKGTVKFVEYKDGNPASSVQVKAWLHSLGWKPQTYKYTRDKKTGDERKIEQVRKDGLLCPSVLDLAEDDPAIEKLDGLTVLNHRIGVLKGFLDSHKDGWVVSGAGGFTNTLRLKHRKPVVNLPSVEAKWGKYCRDVIVADEGKVFVGSDVSSLEDSLKQHFIYKYDPEYVEEMNVEGYDPHLTLGIDAGRVTLDEYTFYLWYEKEYM